MSGVKSADLSLFRHASLSRKTNITHTGGDIFIVAPTPSDMAVLWGENFGTKERKFLRELLASETICFSLKDTYQVHVRTIWHPQAKPTHAQAGMMGLRKRGKFALLLHDLKGELTTSWTWAKFIRPLYRKGFSVIAVDLPGFGKSAVAQVCSCPISRWQTQAREVIAKIMEELSISTCQILAVGHTCGVLLQVLQSSAHRMAGEHVLVNPVFDRNVIFEHVGIDPPPGAKAGWQEDVKQRQQAALLELIRTTAVKMWCLFDRDRQYLGMNDDQGNPVPATKEMQRDWQNAADTYEMLVHASMNEYVQPQIKVTEITSNDLCEAQVGKAIPVRFFVPSRHLKASVARFMANFEARPWDRMYQPNHIAFQSGKTRTAKLAALGPDSDAENDDESDEEHQHINAGLPAQRALDKFKRKSLKAKALSEYVETAEEKRLNQLEKERLEAAQSLREKFAAGKWNETISTMATSRPTTVDDQRHTKRLTRSATEGALMLAKIDRKRLGAESTHSLCAAACAAGELLKKSGALKKEKVVTQEAKRDMKAMNWTTAPFEPELSYGVRQMYLDAFQASVETYRIEQEAELEEQTKFKARTALNRPSAASQADPRWSLGQARSRSSYE